VTLFLTFVTCHHIHWLVFSKFSSPIVTNACYSSYWFDGDLEDLRILLDLFVDWFDCRRRSRTNYGSPYWDLVKISALSAFTKPVARGSMAVETVRYYLNTLSYYNEVTPCLLNLPLFWHLPDDAFAVRRRKGRIYLQLRGVVLATIIVVSMPLVVWLLCDDR